MYVYIYIYIYIYIYLLFFCFFFFFCFCFLPLRTLGQIFTTAAGTISPVGMYTLYLYLVRYFEEIIQTIGLPIILGIDKK